LIWRPSYQESWSAYAPNFTELEDNIEYVEREDEFDIVDDNNNTNNNTNTNNNNNNVVVDRNPTTDESMHNKIEDDTEPIDLLTVESDAFDSDDDDAFNAKSSKINNNHNNNSNSNINDDDTFDDLDADADDYLNLTYTLLNVNNLSSSSSNNNIGNDENDDDDNNNNNNNNSNNSFIEKEKTCSTCSANSETCKDFRSCFFRHEISFALDSRSICR
jgi:hypothetical protein